MPELPEVEVCRRDLLPVMVGRRVKSVIVRQPLLRRLIPADLATVLRGRRIGEIRRRGKYLLFACHTKSKSKDVGWLVVHLGMTGSFRFLPPGTPPGAHDHVDILLTDGVLMRFTDPRRFGLLDWYPSADPEGYPPLATQGVEPLSADFTGKWLHAVFAKRTSPVKPVLMDAGLLVGVGNIYAAESLYRAGISPKRQANKISLQRCTRLVAVIKSILVESIALGGTSFRDYVHSDGTRGSFQESCAVYGRATLPCWSCGAPVRRFVQAGRATFWCPCCQH